MSRPFQVPSYRLHKPTGLAVMTIRMPGGARRDVYLGEYNSDQSRREYAKLVAELATAATVEQVVGLVQSVTIDEVILAFYRHAEKHYRRPDGSTTQELSEYRQVFKPLRELYGPIPATEFGPIGLKAVRQKMIEGGLNRTTINNRIRRLKHVFKWAAAEQLVSVTVHQSLACLAGLQKGRSPAIEPDPIEPVAEEHVRATLLHLPAPIRGMVEFEMFTGCRPSEVCTIRPADVERSGPVWTYRPPQHKNSWRGKPRVIAIGPKAQRVLNEFEPVDPDDFYFSPRRAVAAQNTARSVARVTPRFPSHMLNNAVRRKTSPKRTAGSAYRTNSYAQAITRAILKINAMLTEAAVDLELHIPNWRPNQLRHARATEVRRRFGLEHAGAVLGHSKMSVTELYAQRDSGLALEVAAAMG